MKLRRSISILLIIIAFAIPTYVNLSDQPSAVAVSTSVMPKLEASAPTPIPSLTSTPAPTTAPATTKLTPIPVSAEDWYKPSTGSVAHSIANLYIPSETEVNMLAKLAWGEARGIKSETEQAAVIWCPLNRIDDGVGNTVTDVVTEPDAFHGYEAWNPVTEEFRDLAIDVVTRWLNEKIGVQDSGRVLPEDYNYFTGVHGHNVFRNKYRGGTIYNFSGVKSPYAN